MAAASEPTQRPDSSRELVYKTVRDEIIRGELSPGVIVSENELAKRLSVSRQPVREALLLLSQDDLVEVRPRSGSYVTSIDEESVRQAQFLREAIEIASLRGVRELEADDEADLREILEAQRRAPDRRAFYPLDESFHRRLLEAGGHGAAWTSVFRAKGHLDRARYLGLSGMRPLPAYHRDHVEIVDALAAGDTDRACAVLHEHLQHVLTSFDELQRAHGEFFESPRPRRPRG